jgi:hypothetical protein
MAVALLAQQEGHLRQPVLHSPDHAAGVLSQERVVVAAVQRRPQEVQVGIASYMVLLMAAAQWMVQVGAVMAVVAVVEVVSLGTAEMVERRER